MHGNGARVVHAHGAVTACNSRERRLGDVLNGGAVGASWRQGVVGEHRWGPKVAPGKKSGGRAHRGGRAKVGRWEVAGAAAF
jgi:hypothetical protein